MQMMQIATNIRNLREQRGLTVTQLAEMVGISKQSMSNIELSNRFMSFQTGVKLAQALGVTCEELANGIKIEEESKNE